MIEAENVPLSNKKASKVKYLNLVVLIHKFKKNLFLAILFSEVGNILFACQ